MDMFLLDYFWLTLSIVVFLMYHPCLIFLFGLGFVLYVINSICTLLGFLNLRIRSLLRSFVQFFYSFISRNRIFSRLYLILFPILGVKHNLDCFGSNITCTFFALSF